MKKIMIALAVSSFSSAAFAADFSALAGLKAADIGVKTEAASVPVAPSPVTPAAPVPQDLLNKFQQVSNQLGAIRNDLTWVRNDMDDLGRRASQMIQMNSSDAFFQMDLRRMSSDMSRRFNDLQRVSMDVHGLLNLAQKSADLNKTARDMDWAARDILNDTWPTLEDSAQRLEWAVRSGKPEIVGYDAQWTAMDISRYCRQLSDQARNTSYDTQSLVSKTQP